MKLKGPSKAGVKFNLAPLNFDICAGLNDRTDLHLTPVFQSDQKLVKLLGSKSLVVHF